MVRKEVDGENTFPGHPDRSRHRSGSCLPLLRRLETCDLLVCGSDADRDCDILKQEQEYVFQVHQREGVSRSPRSSNGPNGRGPIYFHCQTKRKSP